MRVDRTMEVQRSMGSVAGPGARDRGRGTRLTTCGTSAVPQISPNIETRTTIHIRILVASVVTLIGRLQKSSLLEVIPCKVASRDCDQHGRPLSWTLPRGYVIGSTQPGTPFKHYVTLTRTPCATVGQPCVWGSVSMPFCLEGTRARDAASRHLILTK